MVQAATQVCESFKAAAEQSERQVQPRRTWIEQQRTKDPGKLSDLYHDQQEAGKAEQRNRQ